MGLVGVGTLCNPSSHIAAVLAKVAATTGARSLLAVATPQYAGQLADIIGELTSVQTVAAATDSVALGNQRDGLSWMAFSEQLNILDRLPLERDASKNWKPSTAAMRLAAGDVEVVMPVANTLFTTGRSATVYAETPTPLSGLDIKLPTLWKVASKFTPLIPLTDTMVITSAVDNMLKTINDQAAASHLENKEALLTERLSERAVYAEIGDQGELIKVVAGGGGLWSPRARMLVLEPPAILNKGDTIRFFLSTGRGLNTQLLEQLKGHVDDAASLSNGAMFEASPPLERLDEKPYVLRGRNDLLPVFGMGSESGFLFNNHKCSVPGQSVLLSGNPSSG